MAMNRNRQNVRLPPEVNRVLYVRNLPYKITGEEMYDIFGKYGAIRYARMQDRAHPFSLLMSYTWMEGHVSHVDILYLRSFHRLTSRG